MEIAFHGATGGTTGSCHLVRAGGHAVLLDCGLFQGHREESRGKNATFRFDVGSIDAVVQSHAHIDHSGKLPVLVRRGFAGAIHATDATADLCSVMLPDSARIQMQDAEHVNRQRMRRKLARTRRPPRRRGERRPKSERRARRTEEDEEELLLPAREVLPLYDEEDVEATLALFEAQAYGRWFDATPNMRFRFHDAGHILGSAWIEGEVRERRRTTRLVFTGDLGRAAIPILRDPEPLCEADVYLSESTYGNRRHPAAEDMEADLAAAVNRLAQRGRGRLLVPAFAVGRTQHLIYSLLRIFRRQLAPVVPVVIDSPLATRATAVVVRHPECFDEAALKELAELQSRPELRGLFRFTSSKEESMALNDDPRPHVVLSASGMMESGRILHHLAHHVENPDTEILIVGFQAQHTLGRRILDGAEVVRIWGMQRSVRARVTASLGYSAHADRDDLLAALGPHAEAAQAVFLVHGEDDQRGPLAEALRERGFRRVELPAGPAPFRL